MSSNEIISNKTERLERPDFQPQTDAGVAHIDSAARIVQLENDLETAKAALLSEHARVQELRDQLKEREADVAAGDVEQAKSSFNIVMELSSEREAALRERKIYKERAENAESQVAELESNLSAAHATTKIQAERIAELERRLVDHAGAPTMVGGDLERLAAGMFPKIVYALESLDTPGEIHKLPRPTNTVGRSQDNDVALESASVSRFHARLVYKADGVWLADLQSVNGCEVNGNRTTGHLLNDGDLVKIGHCRFRFSRVS